MSDRLENSLMPLSTATGKPDNAVADRTGPIFGIKNNVVIKQCDLCELGCVMIIHENSDAVCLVNEENNRFSLIF